jgi:hypothetical protein
MRRASPRKALARDLATYTTPAELHELAAILERHPDNQAAEIRRIISQRRAA